eukprot:15445998-Alexandrium_andersonii.AAC.1
MSTISAIKASARSSMVPFTYAARQRIPIACLPTLVVPPEGHRLAARGRGGDLRGLPGQPRLLEVQKGAKQLFFT